MDESESSTRPGGTRMRERTEPEPIVIEGAEMPSLSTPPSPNTTLNHDVSDFLLHVDKIAVGPQTVKQHQRMMEAQKQASVPFITVMDSFDWTSELEERARQEFESTKEYWTLSKSFKPYYLKLFRMAMLYTARSPRDIVGVQTQLCFALDPMSGWKDYTPHSLKNWSRMFCDKLSQLITHQAWSTSQPGGRAACLTTALQYAVILSTKDKGEWWMRVTDPFLEGIEDAVKYGASPREAHAKMRASLFSSGGSMPFHHISNVFKALEEIVVERPEKIAAQSPYYVTTGDLTVLTRALDSMTDPETGCPSLPTALLHEMAMAMRPNCVIKPTVDELDAVHEQVMLEECRRMLHYQRF